MSAASTSSSAIPEAVPRHAGGDRADLWCRPRTGPRCRSTQLAEIRGVVGPRQITRENNQRFITIQCNVVDRDIGSFVDEAQAAIDASVELPPGYLVTWGGQFRLQQEANRRLALVVPVTLAADLPAAVLELQLAQQLAS